MGAMLSLRHLPFCAFVVYVGGARGAVPELQVGRWLNVRPYTSAQLFQVRIAPGTLLRIRLDQHDLDAAVTVESAQGRVLGRADEFDYGEDSVSLMAPAEGAVRLRVTVVVKHALD